MELLSTEELDTLSFEEKKQYLSLLKKVEESRKYNKLHYFEPYEFQKDFYRKGKDQKARALIAANRCGKTFSAAMEIAMHLTGNYPDWWEGRVWDRPIKAVAAGVTSQQVKTVLQLEFLGTENRNVQDLIGTGSIPKKNIDMEKSVKDGPAVREIYVKHKSGGYSSLLFFAYSQGMEPMQGFTADIAYVDEQDKNNFDLIFSELAKRTATSKGMVVATFTPLQGVTTIVEKFWDPNGELHDGLTNAGWDDVAHLDEETKEFMLSTTPPHLHNAVSRGIPVLGKGAVYSVGEADISYDDVEIDPRWPKIAGIDIGYTTDPTAGVWVAKDPSTGIYYVYDEYGDVENNSWHASQHVPHFHAKGCGKIPIIYDSAARAKVGAHGKGISEMWVEMGLNVLPKSFRNPPWLTTGKTTSSYKDLSLGLTHIYELMATGKIKIHSRNCPNFWREFRKYSYDDKGNPSEKDNHWMDAFRYAIMSGEMGLMEVVANDFFGSFRDRSFDDDDFFVNTY